MTDAGNRAVTSFWALAVARDDLSRTALVAGNVPEIGDGEALLRVDRVGLTANNVTYAPGYVVLPAAGLYKPIWEYDAKTLAKDLSAHLAYGAGTGAAFWLLLRQGREGRVDQRPL